MILLAVAVLFNLPVVWRRYPAYFSQHRQPDEHSTDNAYLNHEGLAYAISQLDSFIDVSEQDLQSIFHLAQAHARNPELTKRETTGQYQSRAR